MLANFGRGYRFLCRLRYNGVGDDHGKRKRFAEKKINKTKKL
jgi:hypothetical protein